MFKFKSLASGLAFVMTCVSFVTTLSLGALFIGSSSYWHQVQNEDYLKNRSREIDSILANETQIALSILKDVYARQQAGQFTEEQAKTEAARLVRNLRYDDGQGYFWIDTYEGINVVLPNNKDEGKNRLEYVDAAGNKIIKDFIANAHNEGGGFTDSFYPKPGETEHLPKRNYTVTFEPYKWVIGTGVWVDEINRQLLRRKKIQEDVLNHDIARGLFCLAALQALFVLFAQEVGKRLAMPFKFVIKRLAALGNNDLTLTEEDAKKLEQIINRRDEMGATGRALKEMHEKLSAYSQVILGMARNDMLTGLANRRHLQEFVEKIDSDAQVTLISLDLDHFKEVNDTYGHQTGDAALLVFAEVLKSSFPDALNVRMGGDEFMVVITKTVDLVDVKADLATFMERLLTIYRLDHELSRLTVSAGIAYAPDEPLPVDLLVQQSDIALYEAKLSGRNCFRVYHPGMENHPGMEKRESKDVSDLHGNNK